MSTAKDVATVLALEEPARKLLEAIEAALPAIERLDRAKYPGADWLEDQVGGTTAADEDYTLAKAVKALQWFCESAGDLAAFDYRFFVEGRAQTVAAGAKDLLDMAGDIERVVALRAYATTVTR